MSLLGTPTIHLIPSGRYGALFFGKNFAKSSVGTFYVFGWILDLAIESESAKRRFSSENGDPQ